MLTGLTSRFPLNFPINRPLTEEEREDHLDPKTATQSKPLGQYAIIKINSTYLECVDKFYAFKGMASFVGLVFGGFSIAVLGALIQFFFDDLSRWGFTSAGAGADIIFMFVFSLLAGLCFFVLKLENFRYTHYPIRFNRKNKKVYVFRTNGTILTANWADIYFTLGMGKSKWDSFWDVRGHILDADGETVRETFSLPHYDCKQPGSENPSLTAFWEFVRRYMEGEQKDIVELLPEIDKLTNISTHREGFIEGVIQFVRKATGGHIGLIFFAPIYLLYMPARYLAMLTSRIPKWSAEIEAECAVDPNDPYLCDEDHPPPKAS